MTTYEFKVCSAARRRFQLTLIVSYRTSCEQSERNFQFVNRNSKFVNSHLTFGQINIP